MSAGLVGVRLVVGVHDQQVDASACPSWRRTPCAPPRRPYPPCHTARCGRRRKVPLTWGGGQHSLHAAYRPAQCPHFSAMETGSISTRVGGYRHDSEKVGPYQVKLATNKRHPGRSGQAWERVRRLVLDSSNICHICGKPVDPDAPPRSRWSPSVDHYPLSLHAMRGLSLEEQTRLALDPANLRVAHYGHNSGRRERPIKRTIRRQSREY
jgi:hypothetical protein